MTIMLKVRWDIKKGRENDFQENQKNLCAVMSSDHPGVILLPRRLSGSRNE